MNALRRGDTKKTFYPWEKETKHYKMILKNYKAGSKVYRAVLRGALKRKSKRWANPAGKMQIKKQRLKLKRFKRTQKAL